MCKKYGLKKKKKKKKRKKKKKKKEKKVLNQKDIVYRKSLKNI